MNRFILAIIAVGLCIMCWTFSAHAKIKGVTSPITVAQSLTDSFANIGNAVSLQGMDSSSLFLHLVANSSSSISAKCVALHSATSSTTFDLPIETAGGNGYTLAPKIFDLGTMTSVVLSCKTGDVANVLPYIKWQIKAATVGATAGQVLPDTKIVISNQDFNK